MTSAKQLARLKSERSRRITFSHHGSRLTSGTAQWLVSSFQELPWEKHIDGNSSNDVTFSHDDRLIFSSGIGSPPVIVRNAGDGRIINRFGGIDYYFDRPHVVAASPDGRTAVVGGEDEVVSLWDLTSEDNPRALRGLDGRVTHVSISPDGKVVAGGTDDGQVLLWDFETGKRLQSFRAIASLTSLTFSPDGKILGLGGRGGFALWEIHTILSHQPILRV